MDDNEGSFASKVLWEFVCYLPFWLPALLAYYFEHSNSLEILKATRELPHPESENLEYNVEKTVSQDGKEKVVSVRKAIAEEAKVVPRRRYLVLFSIVLIPLVQYLFVFCGLLKNEDGSTFILNDVKAGELPKAVYLDTPLGRMNWSSYYMPLSLLCPFTYFFAMTFSSIVERNKVVFRNSNGDIAATFKYAFDFGNESKATRARLRRLFFEMGAVMSVLAVWTQSFIFVGFVYMSYIHYWVSTYVPRGRVRFSRIAVGAGAGLIHLAFFLYICKGNGPLIIGSSIPSGSIDWMGLLVSGFTSFYIFPYDSFAYRFDHSLGASMFPHHATHEIIDGFITEAPCVRGAKIITHDKDSRCPHRCLCDCHNDGQAKEIQKTEKKHDLYHDRYVTAAFVGHISAYLLVAYVVVRNFDFFPIKVVSRAWIPAIVSLIAPSTICLTVYIFSRLHGESTELLAYEEDYHADPAPDAVTMALDARAGMRTPLLADVKA